MPKLAVILSNGSLIDFNSPSYQYNQDRDSVTLEQFENIQTYFLPKDIDRESPLLAPVNSIYDPYPITLFQAGDYEIVLDDNIRFYQELRKQKHNVYLQVISELPHAWQLFSKAYGPGRFSIQQAAHFINHHF